MTRSVHTQYSVLWHRILHTCRRVQIASLESKEIHLLFNQWLYFYYSLQDKTCAEHFLMWLPQNCQHGFRNSAFIQCGNNYGIDQVYLNLHRAIYLISILNKPLVPLLQYMSHVFLAETRLCITTNWQDISWEQAWHRCIDSSIAQLAGQSEERSNWSLKRLFNRPQMSAAMCRNFIVCHYLIAMNGLCDTVRRNSRTFLDDHIVCHHRFFCMAREAISVLKQSVKRFSKLK